MRDIVLTAPAHWETLALRFGVGRLTGAVRQGTCVANGAILDQTQPVGKTLAMNPGWRLGSKRRLARAWMGRGWIGLILCTFAVALGGCAGDTPGSAAKRYRIGISQCVRDPILD
jgi:hypothetical protein